MPRGPCPDCRELIAADIWLVASVFRAFGVVFVEDEFVDKTAGAIIRAATERYARNRAVRDVRCCNLGEKLVSTWRTTSGLSTYSQSTLTSRVQRV